MRALGLIVGLAVLVSLAIGGARIGWERDFNQIAIALNLGDLFRLSQGAAQEVLRELQGRGLRILIVSPQDVFELQRQFSLASPEAAIISGAELERLSEQGFSLFWRLDLWVPPEKFEPLLKVLFQMDPRGLVLSHPFALMPEHLEVLRPRLKERARLVGVIEFQSPVGVDQLYQQGFRAFVRVHTLRLEERTLLSETALVDRYRRAVVERNVRLLELRVLNLEQVIEEFTALQHELRRVGFELGEPSRPAPFAVGFWALIFLWLGLVSLSVLLMGRCAWFSPFWRVWLWLLGALAGLIGFLELPAITRPGAALLAAILVPVAAFALLSERRSLQGNGLLFWLAFSASSALGGLGAAAFLSTEAYFLQIEEFQGVKLALIAPLLFIALLSLHQMERRSFQVRAGLLWAALGVLLTVVLVRSGNLALWPASELEIQLRSRLEEFLIIRPRFKEFLIGHPLLLLWGGLGVRRGRPWALPLLLAGVIGQVSIINSFVHLHTPLLVTLTRTAHGLWLGAALGWLLHRSLRRLFDFSGSAR